MVTTVFPSRRHFYVWTDNPAGEWSEPIVIDFAIGSCDPTLYFEGDKTYFLWKEGDIKICEIDLETGKQLGEIHHLGTGLGGRYPEGPHIYKKDGWYYMMLAEGGTEHGHQVNILRSRSLSVLTNLTVPIQSSHTSIWRCKAARYRVSVMPTLFKHPTRHGG